MGERAHGLGAGRKATLRGGGVMLSQSSGQMLPLRTSLFGDAYDAAVTQGLPGVPRRGKNRKSDEELRIRSTSYSELSGDFSEPRGLSA